MKVRRAFPGLGKLTRLNAIHAGDETFPLTSEIRAVAMERMLEDVGRLR